MRLVQFLSLNGKRQVGIVQEEQEAGARLRVLQETTSVYDLALEAAAQRLSLEAIALLHVGDRTVDYDGVIAEKRLLPPLDHPDPAHCLVTGTGLTHLGSAQARDEMHAKLAAAEAELTDSMRMFQWGLEGGKPAAGEISVQPEWFYKGNGTCLVPPERPLELPPFALDGGEEAELAGLYVIAPSGEVLRVGFALGNEFSDHVMERQNYLYLAHSKLRTCSIGPELRVGELPASIEGRVRILREGQELWSDSFLTGEDHMSYSIASLEHHHFKYTSFRQPGDVHVHFFGAATLSSSAGVVPQAGDVFEIAAPLFGRPLRNPLVRSAEPEGLVTVQAL
jgi:hypothetical protein